MKVLNVVDKAFLEGCVWELVWMEKLMRFWGCLGERLVVWQGCVTETLIISDLMTLQKLILEGHKMLDDLATGWCYVIAACCLGGRYHMKKL